MCLSPGRSAGESDHLKGLDSSAYRWARRLSYFFAAMAVLIVLSRGRAGLRIHIREFIPNWLLMKRLSRISVPAGADSLSIVAGQMWFLHIVNGLGSTAAAAHGIALAWEGRSVTCPGMRLALRR